MTELQSLPEPDFVMRDPQAVTAELIAEYERLSGKTLYPAQVERLLVDLVAYRETLVRVAIQEAAKQNLVRFAAAPMLDYLGELVGVTRLPAQPARTVLRFSVVSAPASALLVPGGTRVETGDGAACFETDFDDFIPAGNASIDVTATCDTAGVAGNGWGIGQINVLVDSLADADLLVANATVPEGGVDAETDERLRGRIILAPEEFTTAGSRMAYVARVKAVHQSIADVYVDSPAPGEVALYPLLNDGLPGSDMLALIAAAVSGERVRPLTDHVAVASPEPVEYTIDAAITLYGSSDFEVTLAAAATAARAWANDRAAGLGRDLVPAQLIAALRVPGVYDIEIASPAKTVLEAHQWAHCAAINLSIAGTADG